MSNIPLGLAACAVAATLAGAIIATSTPANADTEHTNNGCYVQLAKNLGLNPRVTAHGDTGIGPGTGSGKIPGGFDGVATATCSRP